MECTLVHAQNALMVQSREDLSGTSHGHGWGVATYEDGTPHVERQAWAAYHGEHFRRAAARIHAKTVLAHVRRATVGPPALENTHPFSDGTWSFAHNGTVPSFSALRAPMIAAMVPEQRALITGATDSEHIFRLILSERTKDPRAGLVEILGHTARQVVAWCREFAPQAKIGLNLVLSDGQQLAGTRFGRSLYFVEREGIHDCEICGFPHVRHDQGQTYRAIIFASEPLTHEPWHEVPEHSLYRTSKGFKAIIEPLGV